MYKRSLKGSTILAVSLIYIQDICLLLMSSKVKGFLVLPFSKNNKVYEI